MRKVTREPDLVARRADAIEIVRGLMDNEEDDLGRMLRPVLAALQNATVYYAWGESTYHTWQAFGRTREQARAAFRKALDAHSVQLDRPVDSEEHLEWVESMMEDVWITPVLLGAGYRDNEDEMCYLQSPGDPLKADGTVARDFLGGK